MLRIDKVELPSTLISYYNLNNNIILQFILLELVHAQQEFDGIAQLLGNSHTLQIQPLAGHVTNLVGQTKKYIRIFSWSLHDGILTRLKNYCSLYINNLDFEDSSIVKPMQRHAERAWMIGIESLDLMRLMSQNPEIDPEFAVSLRTLLEKMLAIIQQLKRSIYRILSHHSKDEHTLFFVLRHRSSMDALFGKNSIHRLFSSHFPQGMKSAARYISQKYAKRGFSHLVPIIADKIHELEQT